MVFNWSNGRKSADLSVYTSIKGLVIDGHRPETVTFTREDLLILTSRLREETVAEYIKVLSTALR